MTGSHTPQNGPLGRRGLLVGTAATALTLSTVSFANAAPGEDNGKAAVRTRPI